MTVLLGRTSAAGTSDFNSAGQTSVWPFVAVASGNLAVIKARSETVNTATALRLGIYADDAVNARAGALLAAASVDDLTAANGIGDYQATLAATVPIVSGTKYWLGRRPTTDNHNFVGVAGTGYLEKAGDFPDPFGSGGVSTAVDAIIWGEDAANGGVVPPQRPLIVLLSLMRPRFGVVPVPITAPALAAPASTDYPVAVDDALGITDAIDVSVGRFITQADPLGVTDAVVFDRGLVVADALGVTDSAATAGVYQRQIDDALGVTDLAALGFGLTFADALAITDSAALVEGYARTIADALGLTDAQALDRGLLVADALGITDSAAPIILKVAQIDDALGLTDAVSLAVGLSLADALAVTDSLTSTAVLQRTIADALGITDSVAALIIILKQLDDALGITDTLASQAAYVRAVDDALGLADAITPAGVYQRTVADALGITDSAASLVGRGATITDSLGITDATALVAAYVRIIDELLVMTDLASPLFVPFRITPSLPAFGVVIETAPRTGAPIETLRTGRYEL